MEDLYEALEVSPAASQDVISAAYRRLSKNQHPDVSDAGDADERQRRLNRAYEILGDPKKRAVYDRDRAPAARPSAPAGKPRRGASANRKPTRQASKGGRSRETEERRIGSQQLLWGGFGAVLVLSVAAIAFIFLFLDDDDGGGGGPDGTPTATTNGAAVGSAPGPEPLLLETVDHYTILMEELTQPFTVDPNGTFIFGPEGYSLLGLFDSNEQAQQLLGTWGFAEGFFANYEPVGLAAGVLAGRHYVRLQLMRFETVEGAQAAWEHVVDVHRTRAGALPVEVGPVGNAWLGSRVEEGLIENSETLAAYERTAFRRGNLVAIVQVFGAARLLPAGTSAQYAVAIDSKALGEGMAVAPTPFGADLPTPAVLPEETPAPTESAGSG
jgi:hypothetical protein